jgi:hypothetical protein
MKRRSVDQLVYEHMFPKPRQTDPQNFHAFLQRSLILEVRQEVHAFYGHLDTQEAKYPGLDYCHATHRIRLSRWPWHRRLFRAFDSLRLTASEIALLTKWEGTKWAKERYEREQGITIRDTTADGFPDWVEPEDTSRATEGHAGNAQPRAARASESPEIEDAVDEDMDGEESDGELESVGLALNERLRERAARRDAGDTNTVLDEEWELWLKNAMESGELPFLAEHIFQSTNEPSLVPQALFPPRMLSAARAGQWHEIPESLHDMIRMTLGTENPERTEERPATVDYETPGEPSPVWARAAPIARRQLELHMNSTRWRRNYSSLRIPSTDSSQELLLRRTP